MVPRAEREHGARNPRAEEVYEGFQRRREQGEEVIIDDLCREHPGLANALRSLDSLHHSPQDGAAASSEVSGPLALDETLAGERTSLTDRAEALDLHPGEFIGPYHLREIRGRGGFGVVFRAEQVSPFRREVALKVLRLGMDTKEFVARFDAERQALALMSHGSIAKVHDAGVTERGRPFFVMEYVAGEPITSYCDCHRLRVPERLELFRKVCDAIQHAHQKGVIHRDIKPSNVLVVLADGSPLPKVIDFGLAKAVHRPLTEQTLVTEFGQFIGTPEYMAPEQAETTVEDVDTRADIYSLGVVLYELLAGARPFEFLRPLDISVVRRRLREEEAPSTSRRLASLGEEAEEAARSRGTDVRSLRRQLRGDLDWITRKALAKDRSLRYASASELSADIARHLSHEPVTAGPPSAIYRLRKFARKHRTGVSVLLGLCLLTFAAAAIASYLRETRFQDLAGQTERALEEQDPSTAKARLAVLEEEYPARPRTRSLTQKVGDAEREAERRERARQSAALCSEGEKSWQGFLAARERERKLNGRWQSETRLTEANPRPSWAPIWERDAEWSTWQELESVQGEAHESYTSAFLLLHQALEFAPEGSPERATVRRLLEEVYHERLVEAVRQDGVRLPASFFRRMIERFGGGVFARELEGRGSVAFETEPPGASVHCFRYEERDARLVAIAFDSRAGAEDPGRGLIADPILLVEEIWGPELTPPLPWHQDLCPFARGDRVIEVSGRAVRSERELAGVLSAAARDETISVNVVRAGMVRALSWVPFPGERVAALLSRDPSLAAGRLVSTYVQFGFTFAGYPLTFREENLVGVTAPGAPVRADLPRGSYLFVFRKPGFEDARFPVAIPREVERETVRLLAAGAVPPGFVYIPEGGANTGGDPRAFQSLEWGSHRVGGFFVARLEVTTEEWLEFVNDPEVGTDNDGSAWPKTIAAKTELERTKVDASERKVQLVPKFLSRLYWTRDGPDGLWSCAPRERRKPAVGISQLAAIEYAHWRTARASTAGESWRYRLPSDLEWERAARGEDRRTRVWGDYMVWSFCWSQPGIFLQKTTGPAGVSPIDESVFGVRDLAGSVCEHTTGRPKEGFYFSSYRGGSWNVTDEDDYFRIGSRNGLLPAGYRPDTGVRLVVELERGTP